ncbi:MAG: hypothetical protein A2Z35_06400 [Actinobacteria bacterium RBG_19FT_COMBO_36_27]|nr:MAG: hypothetical protein A2Z35_06400 [Actinobacteria bacterium RBG_19FT_COMBO_36_27]
MEKFLTRISRITAYILIIIVILIIITGYRQVEYFTFITSSLANTLHQIYLSIAFLVVGSIYALTAIRRALIRNRIKGLYNDIFLIFIGILIIEGFSYFTFFNDSCPTLK